MSTDEERSTRFHNPLPIDEDVAPQSRTGFRAWMADHDSLVKGLSLVVAYGFIILYLTSSLAFGESSKLSKVFAWLIGCSLFVSYLLMRLTGADDAIWRTYRSRRTERWQIRVAAALWGFIALAFLLILYLNRTR